MHPNDPRLPVRRPVAGVELSGTWADARLWYRVDAPAITASPSLWDPGERFPYVIEVEFVVRDSYENEDPFPLTVVMPCPVHPESAEARPWWRALLHRAALHEADEALAFDGERPFDPHVKHASQDCVNEHLDRLLDQASQDGLTPWHNLW